MSLNKRTYTNQQTVITAENLNEIQDAIIELQEHPSGGGTWGSITGNLEDQTDLAEVLSEQSSQIASLQSDVDGKIDKSAQATKTSAMTTPVGIDANGKLWATPGGSGGGGDMYKVTYDPDDAVADAGGIAAYVEEHGGGGASDFDELTNRPKYNGTAMNSSTDIPEVKTAEWDAKADMSDIPTVPTALSAFTDDLGSSPVHTHSQYLTEHQDISEKENISNKVTSMSASSTDTQYPSAKAVYTQLASTKDMLSDAWTQRTYAVGEYAIYNNKLWKCLVANSSAPSEGANWTEVTIASEFYNSITITQLTLVRTENAFCTVEDFARLKVYEKNGFYYFRCNLQLLTGNATSFIEIGRIQNYSSSSDILISIPSQLANGNVITLQVTANGVITIYGNITQKAFFRAAILSIKKE